ncbi:DNA adenine methylase [Corynebacterium sp. 13CS0277]|nr:DNA adenine methylase [Corynebacterium sp. 13CS0277]
MVEAKPFIKWAGGKRQLLPELRKLFPPQYRDYYEPFMGAAAVFFDLKPERAYLNDINPAVTNLFTVIRDNTAEFVERVLDIEADTPRAGLEAQKSYYLELRARFNVGLGRSIFDVENAALFMVINHRCFNGLYRVNRSGLFNVPFNGSSRPSMDIDNIYAAAQALENVAITTGDFEDSLTNAGAGDFVFLDSPYAPLKADSFTDYTKQGFDYEDHVRLSELYRELDARGCSVMMTNHDTPLIRDLYEGYNLHVTTARRSINSKGSGRTGTMEIIATNYATKQLRPRG